MSDSRRESVADASVLRRMMDQAGGDVRAVKAETALHALCQLDAGSDGSRLASCLVQFLRHPDAQVRSKAALLLGRANLNLNRVRQFLEASDGRVRANAVESLWDHVQDARVQRLLWEASGDGNGRVAINALLGLCKAGEREAFTRLLELAESPLPVLRSGAAWAMGETAASEFAPALEKLERDPDEKVQSMAARARKKLEQPKPDNPEGEGPKSETPTPA